MKVIITFDQLESKVKYEKIKIKEEVNDLFTVKVLMLKGEKGDPGQPTDAQVEQAVADWLDGHPEATTTVQDGAITEAKINDSVRTTNAEIDSLFE